MVSVIVVSIIVVSIIVVSVIVLKVIMLSVIVPLGLDVKVFKINSDYERVIVTVFIFMAIRFMTKLVDLYVKRMLITMQNMQHLKDQSSFNKCH